jgi:hypothetical protein
MQGLDRSVGRGAVTVFSAAGNGWAQAVIEPDGSDLGWLQHRIAGPVTVLRQEPGRAVHWDHRLTKPASRLTTFQDFMASGWGPRGTPALEYLQEDVNAVPELRALYDLPQAVEELPILREKLWIGGRGLVTPLHYDPVETLHWVLSGEKVFKLWRPGHRSMYSAGGKTPFISRVDPEGDRPLPWAKAWPRFPWEPYLTLTVRAGEVLYLPAFMWHHVRSTAEVNVSLNFVWHPSPWKRLTHPVQWLLNRAHVRRQLARTRALLH